MVTADYAMQAANFFRALDWRWQVAHKLLAAPRRRKQFPVDSSVSHLLGYLRAQARKPGTRRHVGPDPDWTALQAAIHIRSFRREVVDEIESRILAGETDATIGTRLALSADAIGAYEKTFFHVRDRLGACDWIRSKVIGIRLPSDQDGPILKLFAYYCGSLALEVILPVLRRRSFPKEVADTFRNDPRYEDVRLRTLVSLTIAAHRVTSFTELANLIDVYEQARHVDMNRVDLPALFKSDCRKYGLFFRAAAAANRKDRSPSQRRSPSDEDYSRVVAQGVAAFRSLAGQSTQPSSKRR